MEGLIREGEEVMGAQGDPAAKDAALIAAAQRVEHYEIAAGTRLTRRTCSETPRPATRRVLGRTS